MSPWGTSMLDLLREGAPRVVRRVWACVEEVAIQGQHLAQMTDQRVLRLGPLKEVAVYHVHFTGVLLWPIKPFYDFVFPGTARTLGIASS